MHLSDLTAVICGYYGAGNAGDEAILESILIDLRERFPSLHPTVITHDPETTSRLHRVASIANNDRFAVIKAVAKCDLVILGGGGLLQDYWQVSLSLGFSRPDLPLGYYFYAALAALYNKPLILFAVGVGPLSTRLGRLYTKMASDLAQIVTVRDERSKRLLLELGVEAGRIHVAADPAFLLTYASRDLDLPRPILGVAVRNWTTDVHSQEWESAVAFALDDFQVSHGGVVLFIPFQRSSIAMEDDLTIARRIQSSMSRKESTAILESAGNWKTLAGAIASCDVMVSMRYHALLFAIRSGIPSVALCYDPKVRSLLEDVSAGEYGIDLGELNPGAILTRLETCLSTRKDLKTRLESGVARLTQAAASTGCLLSELSLPGFATPVSSPVARFWVEELAAVAAGFKRDEAPWITHIKEAVAERRNALLHQADFRSPYDIVCFPGIDWDVRWMRPQHLLMQFANHGHRVFFVRPTHDAADSSRGFSLRTLSENVWELCFALPEDFDVYSGSVTEDMEERFVNAVHILIDELKLGQVLSVVHLSTWATIAYRLRSQFSWPILYDCMDDWSGFPRMPRVLVDKEPSLVCSSDIVIVSAQKLWDRWASLNSRTLLVPNASNFADFDKSATIKPADLPSARPLIGYFGVLDSWLDVELISHAAATRPQYSFVFVGLLYDPACGQLLNFPNVHLVGHRPYEDLPAYLRQFDVCIIPFKVNDVTLSTDPVKFYEYLTHGKPVVSTRLPQLERYRDVAYLADDRDDFVRLLDEAIWEGDGLIQDKREELARNNSWETRYELIDAAARSVFETPRACLRLLFVYRRLGVGGVEVVLRDRAQELRNRGSTVRLLFMEEAGGQPLFRASGIEIGFGRTEFELRRDVETFQPDWVISVDTPEILRIAGQTCPGAGLVYEVHSTNPEALAPLTDAAFLKPVRGIFVPSDSQRQRVLPLLAADKPVAVVPNALSPSFFETEPDCNTSPVPVVLWVGRLDRLKNWRAFLAIANQLSRRDDIDFHLVSAGQPDEQEAELGDALHSLKLGGRLRWIRGVDHSNMRAIYSVAASSGGCLVSTSASESFGMAVLEAMASDCPVVVPDVSGLRDLVHAGGGRVYQAGDIDMACEQILTLLSESPSTRAVSTQRAREFALTFTRERAANRFYSAVADWAAPADQPIIRARATSTEFVSRVLASLLPSSRVVIILLDTPWRETQVSMRPRRWARLLAHLGCVVFFYDPQCMMNPATGFAEVDKNIFLTNTPLDCFQIVERPVVIADSSNLGHLQWFRDPFIVYEFAEFLGSTKLPRVELQMEALALAEIVTVASHETGRMISSERPDAIVISDEDLLQSEHGLDFLDSIKHVDLAPDAPARLRRRLAWREKQIELLQEQIRNRTRPAVELLQNALTEQRKVISERDRGVAFLRNELASLRRILAAREQAIGYLRNSIADREAVITARDQAIEWLNSELAIMEPAVVDRVRALAGRDQASADLRDSIADREAIIAARDQAIEWLKSELATMESTAADRLRVQDGLKDEIAIRDAMLASRQEAIGFLQGEVAAGKAIIAARDDGIGFLRARLGEMQDRIRSLQNALHELELQLPWWRKRRRASDSNLADQ